MTKWILSAAVLSVLVVLPSTAVAEPAHPIIVKAAEQLHDLEGLNGGTVTVDGCHPGRQRATVVCGVLMTGTTEHDGETVEASCSVAIAAVWQHIVVPGYRVRNGGYWFARPASVTACEGSPIS